MAVGNERGGGEDRCTNEDLYARANADSIDAYDSGGIEIQHDLLVEDVDGREETVSETIFAQIQTFQIFARFAVLHVVGLLGRTSQRVSSS